MYNPHGHEVKVGTKLLQRPLAPSSLPRLEAAVHKLSGPHGDAPLCALVIWGDPADVDRYGVHNAGGWIPVMHEDDSAWEVIQ